MSDKELGTPIDEFVREGASRNAILQMQRKVEEINNFIIDCKQAGYEVQVFVAPEQLIQIAVELPKDAEPIRG